MNSPALPDEAYAASLAALPAMTPARLRALLHGRWARSAWEAVRGEVADPGLQRIVGDDVALRERWRRAATDDVVEDIWGRCVALGLWVLLHGRSGYPAPLTHDPSPPPVLFVQGDAGALAHRRVGVVGTRNATPGGRRTARALGRELAGAGVAVVSGLARGIDGAAHQGVRDVLGDSAGDGAPGPIGVVGSGHDVVFPREHRELWNWVAGRGVLISEHPPGSAPLAGRFPQRNRVIAGLSEIIVVVESRATGGSLITVREAMKRDVDVLAVPGSLLNSAARGTNQLIAEGRGRCSNRATCSSPSASIRDVVLRCPSIPVPRRRRPTELCWWPSGRTR